MKSDLNNGIDANKVPPSGPLPGEFGGDDARAGFPFLSAYALALRDPVLFSKCFVGEPKRPH